jgi:hypothetical protein
MRRATFVVAAVVLVVLGAMVPSALAGPGSAKWDKGDTQSGKFAVQLHVADGTERVVAVQVKTEITLDAITSLTFWKKVTEFAAGWNPVVLLGVDLNGDGKYRAKDFKWQFSFPAYQPALLKDDTFIQCEAQAPLSVPDPSFAQVDVMASYSCYGPGPGGTSYGSHYGPLADYGTATIDGIPSNAVVRTI